MWQFCCATLTEASCIELDGKHTRSTDAVPISTNPNRSSRPEIPKRLAARLRRVYRKLSSERSYLAHCEQEVVDAMMHLQVYENDPDLFAAMYYPGVPEGAASYPVQTNIERTREKLSYRRERLPVYGARVEEAEMEAAEAEREVQQELARLRPSTGREPWPREPAPLEKHRALARADHKQSRESFRRYVQKRHAKNLEDAARRREDDARFLRETDAYMEQTLGEGCRAPRLLPSIASGGRVRRLRHAGDRGACGRRAGSPCTGVRGGPQVAHRSRIEKPHHHLNPTT